MKDITPNMRACIIGGPVRISKQFTRSLLLIVALATMVLAVGRTAFALDRVQSSPLSPVEQRRRPTPTPLPSPTPAPAVGTQLTAPEQTTGVIKVQGIVCVDKDRNGLCSADESRIPNVIVKTTDGNITASDNTGQFSLRTPVQSSLNIVIPAGFTTRDGKVELQLKPEEIMQLALVAEVVPPTVAAAPQPQTIIAIPTVVVNPAASNSTVVVNFDTIPLLVGAGVLGLVILLSVFIIRGGLGGMNKTFQQQVARQDAQLAIQHNRDTAMRMQLPNGWQQIAERLVADALLETVSIDEESGIIDASTYPAPKFTVVSRDGREFVFTIDPKSMKKMKLLKKGDRIIEVTSLSPTARMDVQTLWDFVVNTRNMWTATPPHRATWYVIVRVSNRRPSPPPMHRIGPGSRRQGAPAMLGAPDQPPHQQQQPRGWGQ